MLHTETGSANVPRVTQVKTMDFKARKASAQNLRSNLATFEDSLLRSLKPKFIVQKFPDERKLALPPKGKIVYIAPSRPSLISGSVSPHVGKQSILTVASTDCSPSTISNGYSSGVQISPALLGKDSQTTSGDEPVVVKPQTQYTNSKPSGLPPKHRLFGKDNPAKPRHKKVHSLTPLQLTRILNVNYPSPQKLAPEELESLVRGVDGTVQGENTSLATDFDSRKLVIGLSEGEVFKSPMMRDTPTSSYGSSKKVNFSSNVLVWRYIKHQEEY